MKHIFAYFLGPFINRACLMLIGSREYFPLDINQWIPVATAEEIEKVIEFQIDLNYL
jgi:hypothetical protein